MRQITLEILRIPLTILRVMEYSIDVVEDVPFRDFGTPLCLKLCKRPIGDVLTSVGAILVVGVEGEALSFLSR